MEVRKFIEKKNKTQGSAYIIEETVEMPEGGVYEGELIHDNVDDDTLTVCTGPKQSGTELPFTAAAPPGRPWARQIHVESSEPYIYISYEYQGDEVEADDINDVQSELVKVEKEINAINVEIKGDPTAFTWNRLMGVTETEE